MIIGSDGRNAGNYTKAGVWLHLLTYYGINHCLPMRRRLIRQLTYYNRGSTTDIILVYL